MPKTHRSRPWKVFVPDIGPSFSFATEAAAHRRAQALIDGEFVIGSTLYGGYGRVFVYEVGGVGWVRTLYQLDKSPSTQRLDLDTMRWVDTRKQHVI